MALGQGKGQARDSAAIYLAAFGKHPGWDDHIEDIGIETETLATVRRVIYTECISGNIDSGAWEKLSDDQRTPAFAHDFVWWLAASGKEPSRVVVGRLWSSRDGKGRSKYPMAVYCQGDGIPLSVMAREVLPALADVERDCVQATSADAVRAAMDRAREALRSRFATTAGSGASKVMAPADAISADQVALLLDRPELGDRIGPVREGLTRALYAVEREMGAFLPIGAESKKSKTATRGAEVRAAHIRLPALGPTPAESSLVWLSLLARRLAEGASILAVAPRDGGYVDVVVGEPGVSHLYCVRASAKGFPLTTDVPYVIDEAFRDRVAGWTAKWSGIEPAPTPVPKPTPAGGSPTPSPAPASSSTPAAPPPSENSPAYSASTAGPVAGNSAAVSPKGSRSALPKIILITGALAVSAVVIVLSMSGGDGKEQDNASKSPVAQAGLPASPDRGHAPPTPANPGEPARDQTKEREGDQESASLAEQEAERIAQETEKERLRQEALAQAEHERLRIEAARVVEDAERQRQEQEALASAKAEEQRRRAEADIAAEKEKERVLAAQRAAAELAASAEITRTFEVVDGLIAGGAGLDDPASDGRTVREAVEHAKSLPAFAAMSESPSMKGVARRVALLEQIRATDDSDVLLGLARTDDERSLGVSLAAAERLADLGWPAGLAGWETPVSLVQQLNREAKTAAARANVIGVAERTAAVARSMWTSQWRSMDPSSESALAAGVAALGDMGVERGSLDVIERFNLLVVDLRRLASNQTGEDVRIAASNFVAEAENLKGLPSSAVEQVSAIRSALSAGTERSVSAPPIERLGPGSLPEGRRWSVQAQGAGWVVFSPPPGSSIYSPISFVRVETSEGVSYVQASEVSLGLFSSLVDAADAWGDVTRLGRIEVRADPVRQGPAVWQWDIRRSGGPVAGMVPASAQGRPTSRGWFDHDNYMARVAYFEAGKEPDPPSRDHPMQYVSPSAALHVARLAGCRLPTVDEAAAIRSIEPVEQPNRRDQSWGAANEFLWRRAAGRDITKWLDGGIFVPSGERPARRDKAIPAVQTDDGFIFFRAVITAVDGRYVRDAIGNVAEFVFVNTASQSQLPTDPAPLRESINRSDFIRIVGASALSPSEVDPAIPYAVPGNTADAGFSDVGFRMAFGIQGEMAVDSSGELIEEACRGLTLVQKR